MVDANTLFHRLLFDLLQEQLGEWPTARVQELLDDVGASDEQAAALHVLAVQKQGEFFLAWSRDAATRD